MVPYTGHKHGSLYRAQTWFLIQGTSRVPYTGHKHYIYSLSRWWPRAFALQSCSQELREVCAHSVSTTSVCLDARAHHTCARAHWSQQTL
eukprot:6212335-Pleurochrysis_carterae.AAC.1